MPDKTFIPPEIRDFDELPDKALIHQRALQALLGCSQTSIWRWVNNGTLPKPIRLGRALRWRVGDIRAFIELRGEVA